MPVDQLLDSNQALCKRKERRGEERREEERRREEKNIQRLKDRKMDSEKVRKRER